MLGFKTTMKVCGHSVGWLTRRHGRILCQGKVKFWSNHQRKVNIMSDCSACCSAIGKIAPAKARSQVISGEHIFGPQPSNRNSSSCIASPVPKADPIGVAEKAHSTGRLSALDNPLGHPSTSSTATDDQSLSREDTRVGVHVTASSSGSPLEELLLQGSRVTGIAQNAWEQFVREGYTVVDATCGNGFDSKWLAEKIGPQGQLVAFDIQARNSRHCACACILQVLLLHIQMLQIHAQGDVWFTRRMPFEARRLFWRMRWIQIVFPVSTSSRAAIPQYRWLCWPRHDFVCLLHRPEHSNANSEVCRSIIL